MNLVLRGADVAGFLSRGMRTARLIDYVSFFGAKGPVGRGLICRGRGLTGLEMKGASESPGKSNKALYRRKLLGKTVKQDLN